MSSSGLTSSLSTTSSLPNIFQYEVLYYNRRGGGSTKKKKQKTMDGILTIHTPPSSLVTLVPLAEDEHEDEDSVDDNGDGGENSTGESSSDEDDSDDDDDDDDGGKKQSFKQKMKKMRQKMNKRNKKKNQKKKKKAKSTQGTGGGSKSGSGSAKKKQQRHVYSATNVEVSKSVLVNGRNRNGKGGLENDTIVILSQWECQIVRSIPVDQDCEVGSTRTSTVSIATKKRTIVPKKVVAASSLVPSSRLLPYKSKQIKGTTMTSKQKQTMSATPTPTATNKGVAVQQKKGFNVRTNSNKPRVLPSNPSSILKSKHSKTASAKSSSSSVLPLKRKPPAQPTVIKRQKVNSTNSTISNHNEKDVPQSITNDTTNKVNKGGILSKSSTNIKKRKVVSTSIHASVSAAPASANESTTATSTMLTKASSSNIVTAPSETSFPGALGTIQVPHSIKTVLRPHQIEAIVFLWNCLTGSSPTLKIICDDQKRKATNADSCSSSSSSSRGGGGDGTRNQDGSSQCDSEVDDGTDDDDILYDDDHGLESTSSYDYDDGDNDSDFGKNRSKRDTKKKKRLGRRKKNITAANSNSPCTSSSMMGHGAILADEMGLGKTLMTITVLFALYRRNRSDVSLHSFCLFLLIVRFYQILFTTCSQESIHFYLSVSSNNLLSFYLIFKYSPFDRDL